MLPEDERARGCHCLLLSRICFWEEAHTYTHTPFLILDLDFFNFTPSEEGYSAFPSKDLFPFQPIPPPPREQVACVTCEQNEPFL